MKNTTKKLLVSSMALGLAALTTVSSGYAWFTTNTTAKATGIDMTVSTGDGIYISKEGASTYTTQVDISDYFTFTPAANYTAGGFDAMTSLNGTSFDTLTGDNGTTSNAFTYTEKDVSGTGTHYVITTQNAANKKEYAYLVHFTLYFAIATTSNQTLQINAAETKFSSDVKDNDDVVSALRMSTVTSTKDVDSGDVAKKLFAAKYNYNGSDDVATGEVVETWNTINRTEDIALSTYNQTLGYTDTNDTKAVATAGKASGITTNTKANPLVTDFATFVSSSGYLDDTSNTADKLTIAPTTRDADATDLQASNLGTGFKYCSVDFNFWFEGNDPRCYSGILGQGLTGVLAFTTKAL